jgi:hypothetical protein
MIKVNTSGSFNNSFDFLRRAKSRSYLHILTKYGDQGVAALRAATPKESAATAEAWGYEIIDRAGYFSIKWYNTHRDHEGSGRTPVAVLIQYGHGTRGGTFVEGRDFINPAMRPIFDQIAADMWKEVTK